jgi:hypothetical protein
MPPFWSFWLRVERIITTRYAANILIAISQDCSLQRIHTFKPARCDLAAGVGWLEDRQLGLVHILVLRCTAVGGRGGGGRGTPAVWRVGGLAAGTRRTEVLRLEVVARPRRTVGVELIKERGARPAPAIPDPEPDPVSVGAAPQGKTQTMLG